MPRSRTRPVLIAGGAAAALIGVVALAGGGPSGGEEADAEAPVETVVPNEGIDVERQPVETPLALAVSRALPGSPLVLSADNVRDTQAPEGVGADRVMLSTVANGEGFEVTVFRNFDPTEVEAFGLRGVETEGGTSWISAEDPDLTSIYFNSGADGLWLRVASVSSSEMAPVTHDELGQIAATLAADEVVQQEAAK